LTQITLVQNDKHWLYFYLKEYDPITGTTSSFNLTGATSINFYMKKVGSNTLYLSGTCDVYDANNGICVYKPSDTDFQQTGEFLAEIEVHFPSRVITFPTEGDFRIYIRSEIE